MKVAIHQPAYMPWLRFLRKMQDADVFVYLDNALYTKNFINRNRILINDKEHWLTVPVLIKGKYAIQPIREVKTNWQKKWNIKHFRTLLYNYPEGMRMNNKEIEDFYANEHELLIDWNIQSTELLRRAFNIKTPILFESDLGINGKGTTRLVNICRKIGADIYISGPSGRIYLKEKMFGDIKIEYMEWTPESRLSGLHFYLMGQTEALRRDN
ncbi:MAG: WbqC family protein [Desulfobacteraceae bacterium]|nr:WbqC family protein [Desulfobacteraceae bacterium]